MVKPTPTPVGSCKEKQNTEDIEAALQELINIYYEL